MATLLVIAPGKETNRDSVFTILVAETGEALASHFCSHSGFAYDDLYGRREERKVEWAEKFGDVEVKFIDETDISMEELIRRNHAFAEAKEQSTHQ